MKKLDFILCSLPRMNMLYPPGAPAILKAVLLNQGYTCRTKDLVADWFITFKDHDDWGTIDSWNALGNLKIRDDLECLIDEKVESWAMELIDQNPKWIGLSIFSYESHRLGQMLSQKIKKFNPHQKIFMGGLGITNVSERYAEKLFENGIIDAYITGEGEESIIQLAKGNLAFPGINDKNYQQLSKKTLDSQPIPNYDDYDMSLYGKEQQGAYIAFNKDTHTLPITSSRGCVRKCTYCDVPLLWPKFAHRGGDLVADEIIQHYESSGTRKFHFTDSLVNGSMKDFRVMIDRLAKYNSDKGANITWSGQFIFRPAGSHTVEDWKTMGQSGASVLEVGIESGSDDIRFQMGKKFTNDDIAFELENASNNKIAVLPGMIVGWPTETDKHFQEFKDFLIRFHPYAYNKTIMHITLGQTTRLQKNTPLFIEKEKMGIEMIPTGGEQEDLLWWNKNNPTLTFSKRILRRIEIADLALELGYTLPEDYDEKRYLWSKWNELKNIEAEWHNERTSRNQNINIQ